MKANDLREMCMIEYKKAEVEDALLLIEIYNAAFYADYIRYGECPGYGRSKESMEASMINSPKYIIYYDKKPVGVISFRERGKGEYYLGCLCVIPEYQGKGIGTKAFQYLLDVCSDWKKMEVVTPVDKEENIKFYTEKCGFRLGNTHMDGNVKLMEFYMENPNTSSL